MIRHAVAHGSPEWWQLRLGRPTASEFGQIVSDTIQPRKGQMVATYVCQKVAERWLGRPLRSWSSGPMEQGTILESEAVSEFLWRHPECEPTGETVGFIETDDGTMGCSPDGWFRTAHGFAGAEIKCPLPHTHVGYLLARRLPPEYGPQVYGSMLVTGLTCWTFFSYCRGFPPLEVRVEADREILETIEAAVHAVRVEIELGYQSLVKANGGEPRREEAQATMARVFAEAELQKEHDHDRTT